MCTSTQCCSRLRKAPLSSANSGWRASQTSLIAPNARLPAAAALERFHGTARSWSSDSEFLVLTIFFSLVRRWSAGIENVVHMLS